MSAIDCDIKIVGDLLIAIENGKPLSAFAESESIKNVFPKLYNKLCVIAEIEDEIRIWANDNADRVVIKDIKP